MRVSLLRKSGSFGSMLDIENERENDLGGHYGIRGTPQWMAPEVMESQRYNEKVDVYSYGVMLVHNTLFNSILPDPKDKQNFQINSWCIEGSLYCLNPTIKRNKIFRYFAGVLRVLSTDRTLNTFSSILLADPM